MFDSLQPHGLQHARFPCPSPSSGVCPYSCSLSWWWHPTISSFDIPSLLPSSVFPSIKVFFNESILCIKWSKYWSFSFSIRPFNEYSELISFRIDGFDLLAVQGTFKNLLQLYKSKPLILWCLAFFMIELSHPYVTIGKTIALTRQTFVSKLLSLLFICCLGLSWLFFQGASIFQFHGCSHRQSSTVILKPNKIKSLSLPIVSPSIFHEVPWFLLFECWVLSQFCTLFSFTFIKRFFSSSSLSAISMALLITFLCCLLPLIILCFYVLLYPTMTELFHYLFKTKKKNLIFCRV